MPALSGDGVIDSFISACLFTLLLTTFKDTFPLELFVLFPNCRLGCLGLTLLLKSCTAYAGCAPVNTKLDVASHASVTSCSRMEDDGGTLVNTFIAQFP